MKIEIGFNKWEQLIKKGFSLDMLYLLDCINTETDLKTICEDSPKVLSICQTMSRKGLITEEYKLTIEGRELLGFLSSAETVKILRKKAPEEQFDKWWKAFPGTDTFEYKGKKFVGTRALKAKKDDCKVKLYKILNEGEYTVEDMISALEIEISQKKENSYKTGQNKLSYMQNSLTYLNQRTFEPFMELVKAGHKAEKETNIPSGGVEI